MLCNCANQDCTIHHTLGLCWNPAELTAPLAKTWAKALTGLCRACRAACRS